MYSKTMILSLLLFSLVNTAFSLGDTQQPGCPAYPFFRPSTGPLAVINCDFHKTYEKRVLQTMKTFGAPGGPPVILNLGGTLLLKFNGRSEKIDITPEAFQNLKTFCHMTFAVFLSLSQSKPGPLDQSTRRALGSLKKHIQQAAAAIPSLKLFPKEKSKINQLTRLTLSFLKKILLRDSWSTVDYTAYFSKANPLLRDIITFAAKRELNALDKALKPWLAQMSTREKKKIGIVVATAHQARAKEISLQYFEKKFGKQLGEGASREFGLVILEDKFDEDSALKLLARHYLDREAGLVLFDEAARLQRDVLADAAAKLLP